MQTNILEDNVCYDPDTGCPPYLKHTHSSTKDATHAGVKTSDVMNKASETGKTPPTLLDMSIGL